MIIDIKEFTNDNGRNRVMIMFNHHKSAIFTTEIDATKKNILATKLKVVEEYLQTFNPIYTEKEILKTWAKTDPQIKEYYKTLDKRGGSRQGSGRKAGSKNTTPKTERTERFTNAITKEEKEYLGICLEWYRHIKQHNPELLNKILTEYRQYGTFLYTEPLDGKLRTINKE